MFELPPIELPYRLIAETVTILVVAVGAGQLLGRLGASVVKRFATPGWEMLVQRTVGWGLAGLGVANVLSAMGVDLSVLLGAAGFVTVAVGFAAQTSMSNFISGLFLMVESAVRVGDYIELDGISGEVVAIEPLSVRLRTFDNRMVRIPNETLVKSKLVNLSAFPIRRIDLTLTIFQEDDLEAARRALVDLGEIDPEVLLEPGPFVQVQGLDAGLAQLQASYWATRENWLSVRTRMVTQIPGALAAVGVRLGTPRLRTDGFVPVVERG
jgi:small-conductance mechanosensitive channel